MVSRHYLQKLQYLANLFTAALNRFQYIFENQLHRFRLLYKVSHCEFDFSSQRVAGY